jgi:adenosylmethionine-8-amino-7-oxononanoate aminotransferase
MIKNTDDVVDLSLKRLWNPCTQMKKYETCPPLVIKKARGSYLELSNGHRVIDAISSWWCKSLGHNHPRLKKALLKQLDQFEHVMLADITFDLIAELSEKLSQLMPPLNRVFYASDGSCAVEVALKMSLQSRIIARDHTRTQFIALSNGYHGDTAGSLSLCDIESFRAPYEKILFKPYFLEKIPYVSGPEDPLYNDCGDLWPDIEAALAPYAQTATALVLEPIVQGASGMNIYSQDFLYRLRQWTKDNGIHLIVDEIMTGIGRTGKMFAAEHAHIIPDFICLSKGLTSGWLPLSVVLTHDQMYNYFYSTQKNRAFLHSHTYSGNALAASVALETLKIVEEEKLTSRANDIGKYLLKGMQHIEKSTKKLYQVRSLGAIVAAELKPEYIQKNTLQNICQHAIKNGVLLRPLGSTIYWLPPLNIETADQEKIIKVTEEAISAVS